MADRIKEIILETANDDLETIANALRAYFLGLIGDNTYCSMHDELKGNCTYCRKHLRLNGYKEELRKKVGG